MQESGWKRQQKSEKAYMKQLFAILLLAHPTHVVYEATACSEWPRILKICAMTKDFIKAALIPAKHIGDRLVHLCMMINCSEMPPCFSLLKTIIISHGFELGEIWSFDHTQCRETTEISRSSESQVVNFLLSYMLQVNDFLLKGNVHLRLIQGEKACLSNQTFVQLL